VPTVVITLFRLGVSSFEFVTVPEMVRFDKRLHDFGRISNSATAICVFRYQNCSQKEISVRAVRVGCGCIATEESDKAVPPGGTGVVRVRFLTARLKAQTKVRKRIEIDFSPSDIPPASLEIMAEIGDDLIPSQQELFFTADGSTDSQETELRLTRDMLDHENFAQVAIIAPPYMNIREIQRTKDTLVYTLGFSAHLAPATPSPIQVRYQNCSGQEQAISIPIIYKEAEVRLAPKAYFVTIRETYEGKALAELTRRRLLLAFGKGSYRIKEVIPRDRAVEQVLHWRVVQIGSRSGIEIWVHTMPQERIFSSSLDVVYGDSPDASQGRIHLGVYVANSK